MSRMKKCITCGKMFEDFSNKHLHTNVCPDCFAQSCRDIDEYYEKEREKKQGGDVK